MSTCSFSIPFSSEPSVIILKAKEAVERQRGNFTGDANSGSFDVTILGNTISGNYIISGQSLNLTILNKPFLVPCSTIESFLRSQIT